MTRFRLQVWSLSFDTLARYSCALIQGSTTSAVNGVVLNSLAIEPDVPILHDFVDASIFID